MMSELLTSSSFKTCLHSKCQYLEDDHLSSCDIPVEGSLVRTVIEHLQELTSSKMEHKLRIYAEIIAEAEGSGVFLPIISELLTQPDKHAIQPTKNVRRVVDFSLENRYPCHEHSCSLLVEGCSDAWRTRLGKVPSNRRHTETLLTRRMLIMCDELDETS